MKKLLLSLFVVVSISGFTWSQTAPITTLPSLTPTPNSVISLPVTVTNFSGVNAITLNFYYNPNVLSLSTESLVLHPSLNIGFSSTSINPDPVHPGMMIFTFGWFKSPPAVSIINGSTLFSLTATFLGGSTVLNWFSDISGFCEYSNSTGAPISAIPFSSYFVNGSIGCLIPSNPGTIAGLSTVCQNQTAVSYSVTPIADASSYAWTLPSGASIVSGSGTNAITVNFGNSSGNITVKGNNTCGDGPTATKAVTVNQAPLNPASISGSAAVCPGQTGVSYSISPAANATSYLWNVPTSATIVSGANSTQIIVDYNANPNPGTISVWGLNSCGQSTSPSNLNVSIGSPPLQPGSVSGANSVCSGAVGQIFSVTPPANTTGYVWNIPSGASLVSGQGTNQISLDFPAEMTGVLTVSATNLCGTGPVSPEHELIVSGSPATPLTPSGPTQVLWNSVEVYQVPEIPGTLLYQWEVSPNTAGSISGYSNIMPVAWSNFSGYAEVTVRAVNACGQSEFSVSLMVEVTDVVGIHENSIPAFGLYPNPVSDVLNINGELENDATCRIYNSLGQLLYSASLANNRSILTQQYPAGVYMLEIHSGNLSQSAKFQVCR